MSHDKCRGTLGGTQYRSTVRIIGKYRNTDITLMIGQAWLKLYPSHVFVYLKHVYTRNQPQPSRENVRRPQIIWSVQWLKSPVIGCSTNFIIDQLSEIVNSFTVKSKIFQILTCISGRKNVMSMRELFWPDPLAGFEKKVGFQIFFCLKIKCFHS